jgi:hypothetical protein
MSARVAEPTQLAHLTVAPDLHPRCARRPVGEIAGHVLIQVVVADDEVHSGLAGGVASTDDRDRVARAKPRASFSVAA